MNRIPTKTGAIVAAMILFVLLAMAYHYRTALYNELYQLKLVPVAEAVTELYFVQYPTALQETSYTFAIHNASAAERSYTYTISYEHNRILSKPAETKTVRVEAGATMLIERRLRTTPRDRQSGVEIALPDIGQRIHMRVPAGT